MTNLIRKDRPLLRFANADEAYLVQINMLQARKTCVLLNMVHAKPASQTIHMPERMLRTDDPGLEGLDLRLEYHEASRDADYKTGWYPVVYSTVPEDGWYAEPLVCLASIAQFPLRAGYDLGDAMEEHVAFDAAHGTATVFEDGSVFFDNKVFAPGSWIPTREVS